MTLLASFRSGVAAFVDWLKHPSWWPGTLWRWGRVLWICRVAVVSAVAGGAVLIYAPQALDLFADLGLTPFEWAVFFVLLSLWAWILHTVARRALQYDDWVRESCDPALFAHQVGSLRTEFHRSAVWIPRLLGFAAFAIVGYAIWKARRNLLTAPGLTEAEDAIALTNILLTVVGVLALAYALAVWKRRPLFAWIAHRTGIVAMPPPPLLAGKRPFPYSLFRPATHSWSDWALFGVALVLTGGFFVTLIHPHGVTDWFPRVLFVPILLGGWVIAAGELAGWSHRLQTPVLLVVAAVSVVSVWRLDHFNDTRWVKAPPPSAAAVVDSAATRPIRLVEAVRRWKKVNDCERPGTKCPQPIIIAGSGGASRAGFFTATVVGAMIDLGRGDPARYGNVRNRIFAMSTVSGSSVGAVVMRAALADAAESGTADKPPCTSGSQGAWVGSNRVQAAKPLAHYDPKGSWRDCFQQLLAGDFLSPVIAGLAYRDNFPIGNYRAGRAWWPDRGVLLEQAFERRYYQVTRQGALLCDDKTTNGLCRRLGYHPDPDKIGGALAAAAVHQRHVGRDRTANSRWGRPSERSDRKEWCAV